MPANPTNPQNQSLMKRLAMLIVAAAATALAVFPTGQITEKITDNGVSRQMATCLLERDSATFARLKDRLPDRMTSTALYRNYIGCWKISGDSLFLDSILVPDLTSSGIRYKALPVDDIYGARRTPSGYFADWVTDTLRVVSGEIVRYVHAGWASVWAQEDYVTVRNGVVERRTADHNRRVNPVKNFQEAIQKAVSEADLGTIPHRLTLGLRYTEFDADGRPLACEARVDHTSGDSAVDARVARAVQQLFLEKNLLPVYYIRGRYISDPLHLPISPRP